MSSRSIGRAIVTLAALAWLGVIVAAVEQIGKHAPPAFPPLPATACPAPVIGVDSTLAYVEDSSLQAATVAAIHRILRPQVVRDSLLWNQVEPAEGARDWSVPDTLVEDFRTAEIEPLLTIVGSPSWANGVAGSRPGSQLYVPPRGPRLDAWLKRYSSFVAAAVHRYHRAVRRWEIWNEPNLAEFWRPRPDPAAYLQVYETLRATILRVDPTAQVAVGGLGDLGVAPPPDISGFAFLAQLLSAHQPLGNVAIHPYATADHAPDVHVRGEENFDDIQHVHDQLVAAGEQASIWATEWGWSSAKVGKQAQARYLARSLAMLENRYPFVTIATYFIDHDVPLFSQGLLDQNLAAKPAASVFRFYAKRQAVRCRPLRSRS